MSNLNFSVFNWRIMIFKSSLPPNAKYLGCYLSTWMNEWGDNCYPSIARICGETGLSNKTVIKYINVLKECGWLESRKKGFDGQAWAHNQYFPNIPQKAVEEVHNLQKGSVTEGERQCNSGQKAVEEVHTSSTDNSTVKSTEGSYPHALNKKAFDEYQQYRAERKLAKLKPQSVKKLIAKLISFGNYEIQQACIDETISNGWTGVFPPKVNNEKSNRGNTADRMYHAICNLPDD